MAEQNGGNKEKPKGRTVENSYSPIPPKAKTRQPVATGEKKPVSKPQEKKP